eukprot:3650785-Amphidinium_carterae.1
MVVWVGRPRCAGLNLASSRADVAPTEFVPGTWGLLPPAVSTVGHLYEMGYRDMEDRSPR